MRDIRRASGRSAYQNLPKGPNHKRKKKGRRRDVMRFLNKIGVVLAIAAFSLVFSSKANAMVTDEQVTFTFNQPVEIPGMVLPAGTYVFRVLDDITGDRNLIQVLDANQTHVFGTFMTVPARFVEAADWSRDRNKVYIRFAERPAGQPQAIEAWYAPAVSANDPTNSMINLRLLANNGMNGHAFIYPKRKLVSVAKAAPAQPAPVAPPPQQEAAVVPQPAPEPAPAAEPTPAPAEEPLVAQNDTTEQQPAPEQQAAPEQPATLPKTASSLPLVGLMGLLSLTAAFGLLIATRRAS
jgi:hypothetical protein